MVSIIYVLCKSDLFEVAVPLFYNIWSSELHYSNSIEINACRLFHTFQYFIPEKVLSANYLDFL